MYENVDGVPVYLAFTELSMFMTNYNWWIQRVPEMLFTLDREEHTDALNWLMAKHAAQFELEGIQFEPPDFTATGDLELL